MVTLTAKCVIMRMNCTSPRDCTFNEFAHLADQMHMRCTWHAVRIVNRSNRETHRGTHTGHRTAQEKRKYILMSPGGV